MSQTVRIIIRQDVETGDFRYERAPFADYPDPYAFDIPETRFMAWGHTRNSWEDIGEALGAMHGARRDTLDAARDTAELRAQYEEAKAAWEAHCAETGETA